MLKRMSKQSIYFDTDILLYYFEKGKDLGRHAREVISQAKGMSTNPDITIKIPLIVIGEFVMKVLEREKTELIVELLKLLNELKAEITSPSMKSYEIAFKLLTKDKYLKPADALIVAQALDDSTSEWLITTDSDLHENIVIHEIKEKLGSKLKISDKFSKKTRKIKRRRTK